MMAVLAIVFSGLFRFSIDHYAIYLLSALVLWQFFSQTTSAVMSELGWGGSLLTQIYVPPAVFAISALGTGLINLLLSLVPLALIAVATGVAVQPSWLFLPIPIVLIAMFALGIGLFLSRLAVFFGDVVEIYQVLLTAWMYLTPIIYPLEIIPEAYRAWFYLNPIYPLLEVFRTPIYAGTLPALDLVVAATLISSVTLLIGWWYFARNADEFAYRL